jgi:hypothetical protein
MKAQALPRACAASSLFLMGRTGATIASVAILLVLAGLEASGAGAIGRFPFQVLLDPDGSGRIFMNDGSKPSWELCKPGLTECRPFATGNFTTNGAPANSVFWAGGDLMTPLWRGNLHSVAPPSVQGKVRANEIVTPLAGGWEGGWESDYDDLSLSICKTASGERCLQVNHEGPLARSCGPHEATLLDPAFVGRYLRVVDHRYGEGTVFAGVGHPPYYPLEIESGPTISMAVVGKIAPSSGPPRRSCGPPPLFSASIEAAGSAEASCTLVGCRVLLTARCPKGSARVGRMLSPSGYFGTKTTTLRFPAATVDRVEGCKARAMVKINGEVVARRAVHVGPLPIVAEYPEETADG